MGMELLKRVARLDARGQGLAEYALLIALIGILVLGILAVVVMLVGDTMAMIAEVLGSQCRPGLQMVYASQQFTPGEFEPGDISLAWPASGRISQRSWACHHAIDIAAPIGVPVYAARAGEVIKADFTEYPGYGRMIVIRHADGYQTLYGHLSASYVHLGEHVATGELIGLMGSTGRSTGSHLHFEIAKDSWLLDPLDVLPRR
jgi:murein DD-endopeptidase MepM/ murein hydrolase activator NlpD/Flp pilus assembly pilin Flp